MSQKSKIKNITISGKICVGNSTLAKALAKKLGWRYVNAGDFFRDYCKKHGLKLEDTEARSDKVRRKVDYKGRETLIRDKNIVYEAKLGGFFAQGIENVLKVLLVCDDSLRIDRYCNREGVTVSEAKRSIWKRESQNHKVWSKTYRLEWDKWIGDRQINFYSPENYDLVIDTFKNSKEETLEKVLRKFRDVKI